MMIERSKHVGAFFKKALKSFNIKLSALVGMPIEWLCEVHGAKTKLFYRRLARSEDKNIRLDG